MTDNHVHIGQYNRVYYDPVEIADVVMSTGLDGMAFSSTSSCINNIVYSEIEKEIATFLSNSQYSDETIQPYLWYVPGYIDQGITMKNAFNGIQYKGIKLHPYAQNWDFSDKRHMEALHNIFDYAALNTLPIIIHTGYSGIDSANRFERFMDEYRNAKCILAHCRPLDITIALLQKYKNVYCDTAFISKTEILQIVTSGLKDKIIFGSDFPITHYLRIENLNLGYSTPISLREQYTEDTSDWKALEAEFDIGS